MIVEVYDELFNLHNRSQITVLDMVGNETESSEANLRNGQNGTAKSEAMLGVKLHFQGEDNNVYVLSIYSQSLVFAFSRSYVRAYHSVGSIFETIKLSYGAAANYAT